MRSITLDVEIQELGDNAAWLRAGQRWIEGSGDSEIQIQLADREAGHGFGLSEMITITVSIGTGVAADIVADAIRRALGGVIRRVRGRTGIGDGSATGLKNLVEDEFRQSASEPAEGGTGL